MKFDRNSNFTSAATVNETTGKIFNDVLCVSRIRHSLYAFIINPLYLIGLVGNLLCLVVFIRLRRRHLNSKGDWSRACIYLNCLAVSDFTYALLMLEYTSASWNISPIENYSDTACAIVFFIRGFAGVMGGLLFSAFCIDRYFVIDWTMRKSQPSALIDQSSVNTSNRFKTKISCLVNFCKKSGNFFRRSPWLILVICVVLSIISSGPRLFTFRISKDLKHIGCRAQKETWTFTLLHMILHFGIQRYGPALVILVTNIAVHIKVSKFSKVSKCVDLCQTGQLLLQPESRRRLRSEKKLIRACIVLGASYILLTTPSSVHWTLIYHWEMTGGKTARFLEWHSLVGDIESIVASLNSVVNFFVYLVTLDYFRQELVNIFNRCCVRGVFKREESNVNETIRNTSVETSL